MFDNDKPHDHCGVFGVFSPTNDVARTTYFGLYALQHRGQESAGITVSNGRKLMTHKKMGLVAQVFNEKALEKLQGFLAIGHTRYSTTGTSTIENAQPITTKTPLGSFALAHNGNLVNTVILKGKLIRDGHSFSSTTDSEVIAKLIAKAKGKTWEEKIKGGLDQVKGSYSLLLATKGKIYGFRDPLGVRPLVLGKFNHGFVLASESCALDTIGAKFIYEPKPGEGIVIDKNGWGKLKNFPPSEKSAFCIFEYVYFARPDSVLNESLVYRVRKEMGKQLFKEHPAKADFVIDIPDSGTPAATGYAEAAKLPFLQGLIKNRYIGRTFIQPGQKIRQTGIRFKFNPLKEVLEGKRVVVVDDSIVRGNTSQKIMEIIRKAGAKEIHARVASPPICQPCFLGVDIASEKELIASNKTLKQIQKHLKVESLGYLSLKRMIKATKPATCRFCTGCFDGNYPIKINEL